MLSNRAKYSAVFWVHFLECQDFKLNMSTAEFVIWPKLVSKVFLAS